MSLRDQILAADDLPVESVDVPEWGITVRVRSLMAYERDALEMAIANSKSRTVDNLRARLCALSIVDDDGERVFSDADAHALGQKSARALDRVFAVAMRLNGMSAADVDDIVGNSAAGPCATSASSSPANSE